MSVSKRTSRWPQGSTDVSGTSTDLWHYSIPTRPTIRLWAVSLQVYFLAEYHIIFWTTSWDSTQTLLYYQQPILPRISKEERKFHLTLQRKTSSNLTCITRNEYYDRKAEAAPLTQNDYCFVMQPKADHQGSKIPFREFRWIGPHIIEKVLPIDNYIVRNLSSNKTLILHRIRLRKYEPNTDLQYVRLEGNLQPDDEIIIPQDDFYVITCETNFGDFESGRRNETDELPSERAEIINDAADMTEQPDQILTDVDLRSTRRDTTAEVLPDQLTHESDDEKTPDDETSSGGSDNIVPEVLGSEKDDMIVGNASPRGGKYHLRPNPPHLH